MIHYFFLAVKINLLYNSKSNGDFMDLEILRILNHYNIIGKFADRKFVMEICHIISENAHLNDYINHIEVVDDKHGMYNHYRCYNRNLYFNLSKTDAKLYGRVLYNEQSYYFYNLAILTIIFHELTHVYQEYLKNNDDKLLLKGILLLADPDMFLAKGDRNNLGDKIKLSYKYKRYNLYYRMKYLNAPEERMAIITSYVAIQKIIDLMNLLTDSKVDAVMGFNAYIDYGMDTILKNGYKLTSSGTNSPTIDYLRKMPHNSNRDILNQYKSFNNLNTSLDERLFTGLYLTNNEYINLCSSDKVKIKKIDSFLD